MSATMDKLWNEWCERSAQKSAEPTANTAQPEAHSPAVPDNDAAAWEAWARQAEESLRLAE
jgi:hypothetical protein